MFEAALRITGVLACLALLAACGASAGQPQGVADGGGGASAAPDGAAGTSAAGHAGAAGAPASPSDAAGGQGGAGGAGGSSSEVDASGARDAASEAGLVPAPDGGTDSALPKNVLIFTRSTNAYVHESKPIAAMAIKTALASSGVASELGEDTGAFTAANLARFGAIVLVDTTGKPLGDPGTAELDALAAFVRAGGGLVAIHAATATTYAVTLPYVPLLGAREVAHPGDVRPTTCFPKGAHPSVAALPPSFTITDEIFTFDNVRADVEVVVECLAVDGKTHLPISWHRVEGAGRVFNSALGHLIDLWTPDGLLLKQHVLPGVLWTLGL